jgi:hypothetical protein
MGKTNAGSAVGAKRHYPLGHGFSSTLFERATDGLVQDRPDGLQPDQLVRCEPQAPPLLSLRRPAAGEGDEVGLCCPSSERS